jgi:hypothetical protein
MKNKIYWWFVRNWNLIFNKSLCFTLTFGDSPFKPGDIVSDGRDKFMCLGKEIFLILLK